MKTEYDHVRFECDMGQWICRHKRDSVELGLILLAAFDLKYKLKPDICFCHYWHDSEVLDEISAFLKQLNEEEK